MTEFENIVIGKSSIPSLINGYSDDRNPRYFLHLLAQEA